MVLVYSQKYVTVSPIRFKTFSLSQEEILSLFKVTLQPLSPPVPRPKLLTYILSV